jgi:hypothetical protein
MTSAIDVPPVNCCILVYSTTRLTEFGKYYAIFVDYGYQNSWDLTMKMTK